MLGLSVAVDASQFNKSWTDLQMTQYPFALAKTLTDLATGGQFVARQQTRKAFKLHGDWIPNNIRITPAKKSDFKYNIMRSEVRTTQAIAFMSDQEPGGPRKPIKRAFVVPSVLALRLPDFKTSTGSVKAKYKPKNLLKAWNEKAKGGVQINTDKINAYIAGGLVFARIKNANMTGQKKSIMLFPFERQVRIKPLWHFRDVVLKRTAQFAIQTFNKNMDAAVRSMK